VTLGHNRSNSGLIIVVTFSHVNSVTLDYRVVPGLWDPTENAFLSLVVPTTVSAELPDLKWVKDVVLERFVIAWVNVFLNNQVAQVVVVIDFIIYLKFSFLIKEYSLSSSDRCLLVP